MIFAPIVPFYRTDEKKMSTSTFSIRKFFSIALLSMATMFRISSSTTSTYAPEFAYSSVAEPDWPALTFTLTRYNDTNTAARNRLHIEFYNDDPDDPAFFLQKDNKTVQLQNATPDPYGMLADLYGQAMAIETSTLKFVVPSARITIPVFAAAAKWFVAGFKPDGMAGSAVPITYVVAPTISSPSGFQMTFPMNPYDVTWCDGSQGYSCPPGSPWNSGIPYFYPKAANIDVNDALFDAIVRASASYGAIYDVAFDVKSVAGVVKTHVVPYVPTRVRVLADESMPKSQKSSAESPTVFPSVLNGL